jgi:hypothetical protein
LEARTRSESPTSAQNCAGEIELHGRSQRALEILERQVRGQQREEEKRPSPPSSRKTDAWLTLAMKRAIIMAADEGLDGVVFSTGERMADLDLSKQVQQLSYFKNKAGLYELKAIPWPAAPNGKRWRAMCRPTSWRTTWARRLPSASLMAPE